MAIHNPFRIKKYMSIIAQLRKYLGIGSLLRRLYYQLRTKTWVTVPALRSATDDGLYPPFCRRAALEDKVFASYKRQPIYRRVLEHVSFEEGKDYLNMIEKDHLIPLHSDTIALCYANDAIGNPKRYNYENLGNISPSNLRYLKVCSDLKKYFGDLEDLRIAEIGAGYGGQAYYIDALLSPAHCTLFDLSDVLLLIQRYLENFLLQSSYTLTTLNQFSLSEEPFDLVISNYAFSELPKALQIAYLKKVMVTSKRGYLTMNHTYNTQYIQEDNYPLSFQELQTYLPRARRIELSKSDADNYLIVWGDNI